MSYYHSLIDINQIKHVLCCLCSPTKVKWKAATALLSVTGPQCLLLACYCQCFVTNIQVQGHACKTFLAERSSLNVASLIYLWRDVSFKVFMKCCILSDVQSNLASPDSGWGVSIGSSQEISFPFGSQMVYLKQPAEGEGAKRLQTSKKTPTLKSLLLRPECVLEGA